MTYDLRFEPWLPLRRLSGRVEWVTPFALTDRLDDDPFVALASPRADFDAATTEFLIGLLAAALDPADEDAWGDLWSSPPSPEQLRSALAALPDGWDLTAEGPAFMQDFHAEALREVEASRPEQLLLDAPGDQGILLNTDLFVKRRPDAQLGRPVAAMALLALQTYAPSGGKGHRVSLRGGGPLTTLVDPRPDHGAAPREHAMWWLLLANLPTADMLAGPPHDGRARDAAARFPWLGPTRTSERKQATEPSDGDGLQAFFGMPRRIRLRFDGRAGPCALTGRPDDVRLSGFAMASYGTMYQHWIHPLSPYYLGAKDAGWLTVHGQPDGVTWRDWLAFAMGDTDHGLRPAAIVARFSERRAHRVRRRDFRLRVHGYDFNKMKARAWVSGTLPGFVAAPERTEELRDFARRCVNAASLVASVTKGAVDRTLYAANEVPGDGADVKPGVWAALERGFYGALNHLAAAADGAQPLGTLLTGFHRELARVALSTFDAHCSLGEPDPATIRRTVQQRQGLIWTLQGRGKLGAKLFQELGLPPVEPPTRREGAAKPARGKAASPTPKKTRKKA